DVRLCASGELVLLHDFSLARVTNGADSRPVHSVRWADLPPLGQGIRIPALAEALDLCRGRIVNVEGKADVSRRLAAVRAAARTLGRARHVEIVLSSFDPAVVLALAAAAPRTPRAMLVAPSTPRLSTVLPLVTRGFVSAAHLADALVCRPRVQRLHRV